MNKKKIEDTMALVSLLKENYENITAGEKKDHIRDLLNQRKGYEEYSVPLGANEELFNDLFLRSIISHYDYYQKKQISVSINQICRDSFTVAVEHLNKIEPIPDVDCSDVMTKEKPEKMDKEDQRALIKRNKDKLWEIYEDSFDVDECVDKFEELLGITNRQVTMMIYKNFKRWGYKKESKGPTLHDLLFA